MKPNKHIHRVVLLASLALVALALGGCTQDFDPFNLVTKTRILAIQAEPAQLLPGESTTLSALVYTPDDQPFTPRWSWCPFTMGAASGYECAVAEGDLRDSMNLLQSGAGDALPPFDLGSDPTATFVHTFDPTLVSILCENLGSFSAGGVEFVPNCDQTLPVTVTLTVENGDESMTAVKQLSLHMTPDAQVNENPTIGEIDLLEGADETPWAFEETLPFNFGDKLRMFAHIPGTSAQEYVNADDQADRESLFMTWFVSQGETEFQRTTFLDGEVGFDVLGENSWTLPSQSDADSDSAVIYLVLQDNRGGVVWETRHVDLGGQQ